MSGAEQFLIDTSAHVRIVRPKAEEIWGEVIDQGRIGMCEPTEAELLYSSQSKRHYTELKDALADMYVWRPVPSGAWRRLLEIQQQLVNVGQHRSAGIADLMVAVTAMHHGLTVLHYDRDFEVIAKHTDLRARWLAEPGSLD
ncbi:PIN domain nuclease [Kitasatospora sp. NPDC001547]|uniref:PIN domain nuclease n=1 Tax=Kitasatospora sp. NPDC001547 TaxID=3364015 RepID=UPI0036A886A2|nr:PIN domain nuclease [Kitasatospora sp. Xyl93]